MRINIGALLKKVLNLGIRLTSFPKAKKEDKKKTDYPGPGAYKVPCNFGELPHYDASKSQEFKFV
jgi:hypothetical protein